MKYEELKRLRPGTLVKIERDRKPFSLGVVLGDSKNLTTDVCHGSVVVQSMSDTNSGWYDKKHNRQSHWLIFDQYCGEDQYSISEVVCNGPD